MPVTTRKAMTAPAYRPVTAWRSRQKGRADGDVARTVRTPPSRFLGHHRNLPVATRMSAHPATISTSRLAQGPMMERLCVCLTISVTPP